MGALQSVSYELKQKYHGAKRNVLFDDSVMDLALDFCTEEGMPWRRMTSMQALERRKKNPGRTGKLGLDAGEIEELLDTDRVDGGDSPASIP